MPWYFEISSMVMELTQLNVDSSSKEEILHEQKNDIA